MNSVKNDFTQGSIPKKLILFMIPVLGALILQAAYGAVDLLVVGRFGSTSGLSAVSTGSQVLNLVTFVLTQLAMGITVLIARYLGERRPDQIGPLIGGSVVIFGILCAVLLAVLVAFARPLSVRLPLAYIMSIQPDASLTLIGLSAPAATICGIVLNVVFYVRQRRRETERLGH